MVQILPFNIYSCSFITLVLSLLLLNIVYYFNWYFQVYFSLLFITSTLYIFILFCLFFLLCTYVLLIEIEKNVVTAINNWLGLSHAFLIRIIAAQRLMWNKIWVVCVTTAAHLNDIFTRRKGLWNYEFSILSLRIPSRRTLDPAYSAFSHVFRVSTISFAVVIWNIKPQIRVSSYLRHCSNLSVPERQVFLS